eukprot:8236628-Alexandrium_andersonii.AAC.1
MTASVSVAAKQAVMECTPSPRPDRKRQLSAKSRQQNCALPWAGAFGRGPLLVIRQSSARQHSVIAHWPRLRP